MVSGRSRLSSAECKTLFVVEKPVISSHIQDFARCPEENTEVSFLIQRQSRGLPMDHVSNIATEKPGNYPPEPVTTGATTNRISLMSIAALR